MEVFKFRSVRSIVIARAKTGNDNKRRRAINTTAHTNKGIRSMGFTFHRIFRITTSKPIMLSLKSFMPYIKLGRKSLSSDSETKNILDPCLKVT